MRRVRDAGGAVHDLALVQDQHLLLAVGGAVVQVHLPLDHVHHLVAGVGVEWQFGTGGVATGLGIGVIAAQVGDVSEYVALHVL